MFTNHRLESWPKSPPTSYSDRPPTNNEKMQEPTADPAIIGLQYDTFDPNTPKNNKVTTRTPTMTPEPTAYRGSYTSLAHDCHHVVHYSVPSARSIRLSDEYRPCDFVCVSANTLLCTTCENAMRAERDAAAEAYNLICACGETNDEAAKRYNVAAIKLANFEGRMADRNVLISQGEALKARKAKWEAEKRVRFDVEEGMGAGEKVVAKKAKKQAIMLGPP